MAEYCQPQRGSAALITISAQRDFTTPGSPICAKGASRAVPRIQRVIQCFRDQRDPIFHSVRLYRPDGSNVDSCRRHLLEEGQRFLMPGSLGAELIDSLKPDPEIRLRPEILLAKEFQSIGKKEEVFYRPRWGAFHDTGLEKRLRGMGVTTLVICGFSFTTGMRATIYEASARDFRIVLVSDAVCGATDASLSELARIGIFLVSSETCQDWIAGAGQEYASA